MSGIFIIAEAGVNHNGSLELARRLVEIAAEAGADAVKFQTFKAENLVSAKAPKALYQMQTTAASESQYDMLKKLELDESAHAALIDDCAARGIQFLSTPFDLESLDLLVTRFQISRIKLSSGEVTNAPLLLRTAQYGRPVILSTGMSTIEEIETALGILAFGYMQESERPALKDFQRAYRSEAGQSALKEKVVLLHCTTEYPAPFEDTHLLAMDTMRSTFALPVGFSDHTTGIAISIAAAARGAAIIEKHFTLDKSMPGPDHRASLEPDALKAMVASIRQVEAALGSSRKTPSVSEMRNRDVVRKSLVAARDIQKGETLTEINIAVKRPGTGVSPLYYWDRLGIRAGRDYHEDEMIE